MEEEENRPFELSILQELLSLFLITQNVVLDVLIGDEPFLELQVPVVADKAYVHNLSGE